MLAQYMLSSFLFVCPFVCPSHADIVPKRLQHRITHTTPQDSPWTLVSDAKDLGEISMRSPPTGAPNRGGVGSDRRFLTNILLYLRNGER